MNKILFTVRFLGFLSSVFCAGYYLNQPAWAIGYSLLALFILWSLVDDLINK